MDPALSLISMEIVLLNQWSGKARIKESLCDYPDESKNSYKNRELGTNAVNPADVGRDTGEDGGPSVSVAARGGHKAGHTMDNPLAIDLAVQGATRVTLYSEKTHNSLTLQLKIHNWWFIFTLWAQLDLRTPFSNRLTVTCSSCPQIILQSLEQLCAEHEFAILWHFVQLKH